MKSPAPSPRISWLGKGIEDARLVETPRARYAEIETPRTRYAELKFVADTESEFPHDDVLNGDNQGDNYVFLLNRVFIFSLYDETLSNKK